MPTQKFPGRYESLERIASFIRAEAETTPLSHSDVFAVETAVDEAVSNIIEHAYQGEEKGEIVCTCTTDPSGIVITLEDTGKPFDPQSIPVPNLDVPLMDRSDHGLGVYMMRKWMDEVHYEFENGINRVIMVKRVKKQVG
jgi:serine/threonine-protein kinase RsbW